jgi:hypothetical protein
MLARHFHPSLIFVSQDGATTGLCPKYSLDFALKYFTIVKNTLPKYTTVVIITAVKSFIVLATGRRMTQHIFSTLETRRTFISI